MKRRWVLIGMTVLTFAISFPSPARGGSPEEEGTDYAGTALNILPSGQYGAVPPPEGATDQAQMYDALTTQFDDVTDDDLTTYFKSQALGASEDEGPLVEEEDTPDGITIVRDKYNVPHITGETYDDVIKGAGWVSAQDRGLLLEQARYNARVAAIDAPGLRAIDLIANLATFEPSDQTEQEIAEQTKALEAEGAKGKAVLRDIDTFISGINAYYEQSGSDAEPWTRNDIYALNAVKGQFVGDGGGGEASRSMFLDALIAELGEIDGTAVFEDLRESYDPESAASVPGSVEFQPAPRSTKGNMILDDGSFTAVDAVDRQEASNALLVSADRSANGHPLMVAGPQIGYFYPGFLLEMDLNGPGIHARGASTVPLPGYILIGRSEDYAWSLTSAGLDIIDTYVETLCEGSDTKYEYKGKCEDMEEFDAGILDGEPVTFFRTVHGPVIGYATVDGERVAVTRKRASYGRDVVDQLLFRDLTLGEVDNARDFFRSVNQTPQTFNSFYIDDQDIAVFTSGAVPIRPRDVDPGLPIDGRGNYEWGDTIGFAQHPRGINPPNGEIINWNNRPIGGYRAADENWALGSIQRVELLTDNLSDGDDLTLGDLVAAMNAGATQDVRVMQLEPVLAEVLRGGPAPSEREEQMLQLLDDWREAGGSRLDRDQDGLIDDPGAAIMDAAWPKLADAWADPVLGDLKENLAEVISRFDQPPGGQYEGWHGYMDKDLRTLLDEDVEGPFTMQYCGAGDLDACRESLWEALRAAGDELAAAQGDDPSAWRADATAERIEFVPGLLPFTMQYSNRPSGIQQVITFTDHRPR